MAPPAIPPSLPPSVEEAYRRKCVQLKNRTHEVEDANDAARLRLARIKRQVEKLRVERAFLLEQLTKRTSTNVEDSDGSPSPPPTDSPQLALPSEIDANPRKPKDRPLRTKRGHRKQSVMADGDAKAPATGSFTTNQPPSPGSETFSHPPESQKEARANGVSKASSKKPADGFELYCEKARPALEAKKEEDEELNVDEELEKSWKELPDAEREEFQSKADQEAAKEKETDKDKDKDQDQDQDQDQDEEAKVQKKDDKPNGAKREADEDVEMGNYDTEDQETQAEDKAED